MNEQETIEAMRLAYDKSQARCYANPMKAAYAVARDAVLEEAAQEAFKLAGVSRRKANRAYHRIDINNRNAESHHYKMVANRLRTMKGPIHE